MRSGGDKDSRHNQRNADGGTDAYYAFVSQDDSNS